MPRRHRLVCGLAASVLLLTGCTGGSPQPAEAPTATASATATSEPTVSSQPLIEGLDVCSLASGAQVRRAAGQVGEPTYRSLTRIKGYDGLVDQCGFGVSFDSYTFVVSVGLAPATRSDLARLRGEPVPGIGDAARAADLTRFTTVSFLKGSTLVQVLAVKPAPEVTRLGELTSVARAISAAVPSEPPQSDVQTKGVCADVDVKAVQGVLGAAPGLSRTLVYKDRSAVCSWATGVQDARTVAVSVYSNRYAGPFLAEQKTSGPSRPVPGITGDAFTIPGVAYVIADDGQAVSVGGTFAPQVSGDTPLPVTPALRALLTSAVDLMQ